MKKPIFNLPIIQIEKEIFKTSIEVKDDANDFVIYLDLRIDSDYIYSRGDYWTPSYGYFDNYKVEIDDLEIWNSDDEKVNVDDDYLKLLKEEIKKSLN